MTADQSKLVINSPELNNGNVKHLKNLLMYEEVLFR